MQFRNFLVLMNIFSFDLGKQKFDFFKSPNLSLSIVLKLESSEISY